MLLLVQLLGPFLNPIDHHPLAHLAEALIFRSLKNLIALLFQVLDALIPRALVRKGVHAIDSNLARCLLW